MDDKEKLEQHKVVYVKVKNEDEDKNRKRRIIIAIIISIFLLIDIILAIIFIPKFFNKKNTSSSKPESSYVVGEDTPKIYNNLLRYINIERSDIGGDDAKSIIALTYTDKNLYVTYRCETHPGYINIECDDTNNVTEALNKFKDASLELGDYATTIINETYQENKTINIDGKEVSSVITKGSTKEYVSFITQYDESTLMCVCHQEYQENGSYNVTKVTTENNPTLFDFYYYNLFVEK